VIDIDTVDFGEISPDEFARLVKDLSKRELVAITAGPSRARIVDEILGRMAAAFDPEAAGRLKALIRWRIVDDDQPDISFEIDIADGTCQVSSGTTASEPRVSLTLSAADFARLASGNASGTALFMTRRLKVTGDLGLAATLTRYFNIPKA
jgi:predicted lipid carrier protein YhbT